MKLNIAICDDHKPICSQIENIIIEYAKKISIGVSIDIFYDGSTLMNHIQEEHNNYDLIFLDIAMGDINGVDVGVKIRRELKDHKIQLIYVSGKKEYDRQLFEVQPLLLLPKPIEKEKLTQSIDLAIEKLALIPKLYHYKKRKEYFSVPLEDIICFENMGRNIKIKMTDSEDVFVGNLKDVGRALSPYGFIQVSQSVVINYQFVSKYSREEIILVNKEIITIPKNKRTKVKEKFLREIERH